MVNYVCRTCLYVCDNEFSFKKLDKVKAVLELFVPEVKNLESIGKYSLICEQCYYFLKNIEKFRVKCMETQKKLYSMNLETIRENHDNVLRSVFNKQNYQRETVFRFHSSEPQRKKIKLLDNHNINNNNNNNETISNILQTSIKPSSSDYTKTSEATVVIDQNSVPNHMINYRKDLNDLQRFREFGLKPSTNTEVSKEIFIMNYDEDDELITRNDLVTAGISPEWNQKESTKGRAEDKIIELNTSDDEESAMKPTRCDTASPKRQISNNLSDAVEVKKEKNDEVDDDENPGFFNKQSSDGFYKCKLCGKHYKTSKGLYNHTKEKHADQVRIHHCEHCSFFTLWKSALTRHYSVFHEEIFQNVLFKCYYCNFVARSKDQLSHHRLDNHVYKKFISCTLCRARFPDNLSFAKHVEKEHLDLDTAASSNYCSNCGLLFLTNEDFDNHIKEIHGKLLC